jgi:hypothetical protein
MVTLKSATIIPQRHTNEHVRVNQENWSRYPLENQTKVILVAYPDRFRLEEAKSLVESLQNEIVKAYTQKYLDRAEFGMGSGKAEAIKNFVKEYPVDEINK